MKRFDFESYIEKLEKKIKTALILLAVYIVLFALIFMFGLFLSNFQNRFIIMFIFSLILSIFAIFITIHFIFSYLKNKKDERQLAYILGGYLSSINGVYIENKGEVTTVTGRKVMELVIKDNDDIHNVYLDLIFKDVPFKIGDNLNLKTSENVIIMYEVNNG